LNILVDAVNGAETSHLIEETLGNNLTHSSKSAILSIFPHKKNPEITGRLFEAFDQEGVEADALANSPSAISVVLRDEMLARASHALFEPFSFIYKEVVASYQEQKPKVYGLDYQDGQELLQIRLTKRNIGQFSLIFKELARLGVYLTFITTGPLKEQGLGKLAFSLPAPENQSYAEILAGIAPEMVMDVMSPMGIFSMNGPHFGDRYGIVSELLAGFEKNGIDLRGLSSTIASITGIVPSCQLESAVRTIQESFEVPSVTKKE
jgi:aspartokinase